MPYKKILSTSSYSLHNLRKYQHQSLISHALELLLTSHPKTIVLSGPSGFLGSRVLNCILEIHQLRLDYKEEPGEVVLLSSSPGTLMQRLSKLYGIERMKTVRASRVDYYAQHDVDIWRNHLGSLGLRGPDTVFINLAAVAGPQQGKYDALMDVNYRAPLAACKACEELEFGHWIQSSTQAINAERAGQVPYARAKAMADFAISNMALPVTITVLGLLYSKHDGLVGQRGSDLNLSDLCRLPLTPIMGSGTAPLQPHEVNDAAERIAFLGLTEPSIRPIQYNTKHINAPAIRDYTLRIYDAVGPETMSIYEMLRRLSLSHRSRGRFRPVQIDYRNMERVLNIKSLGNMNRQFVSLLRSEQDANQPIIGDPTVWTTLIGSGASLVTLKQAFDPNEGGVSPSRRFPITNTMKWVWDNPKVIIPGAGVVAETVYSYFTKGEMR